MLLKALKMINRNAEQIDFGITAIQSCSEINNYGYP